MASNTDTTERPTAARASAAPAFHTLRVAEVRQLTDDSVEVAFHVPAALAGAYAFQHGQHLTVRREDEGKEIRRTYSISSACGDPVPRIGIRHIEGGRMSRWMATELRAGDELEVMTPAGRFTVPLEPTCSRHWLTIAAGSGITPILSIVRSVLAAEPSSSVTLIYGNRSIDTIMYRRELDDLKSTHLGRLNVAHILSRERRGSELLSGRIDPERIERLCAAMGLDLDAVDEVFVCGPESMAEAVRAMLLARGLVHDSVHVELFETAGAAATEHPAAGADIVCRATVVLHGIESPIEVLDGERLLDAARRAGLDVPFACTGGVCATCRAHVTGGEVTMVTNHALEPHEVAEGYALTCQSLPLAGTLRIDYDRP